MTIESIVPPNRFAGSPQDVSLHNLPDLGITTMLQLLIAYWPLAVALGLFAVAAACCHLTLRVPNSVNYSALAAAWLMAGIFGKSDVLPEGGGLVSSVACMVAALVLSLPLYAKFGFPAGCVKAQAAAAAWIGCGLPLAAALAVTTVATLSGIAVTFLTVWYLALVGLGECDDAFEFSHVEKPRPQRLMDAQMPMSVASCLTIVLALVLGWL